MLSLTADILKIPETIAQPKGYSIYTALTCAGAIFLTAEIYRRLSLQFDFYTAIAVGDATTLRQFRKYDLKKGPFPFRLIFGSPLVWCIRTNNDPKSIVDSLVDEFGADVNGKLLNKRSALHIACMNSNEYLAKLLIEKGADVNPLDKYGYTPLHFSADRGDVEIVKKILATPGAMIDPVDSDGSTPLLKACSKKRWDVVKLLIAHGANIHSKTANGDTALHYASSHETAEIAKIILKQPGVDCNLKSMNGYTPLLTACTQGNWEVAKLLIEEGADINSQDLFGETPLHHAIESNVNFVEFILDRPGVSLELEDSFGNTPLTLASNKKLDGIKNALIEKGAKFGVQDSLGNTELHYACEDGDFDLVNTILDKPQIDIDAMNKKGETALLIACMSGNSEFAKLLIERGANVHIQTLEKNTALLAACSQRMLEVCKLLLENNADPNIRNNFGYTSLNIAIMVQGADLVKLLLENGAKMEACSWTHSPMFQGLFSPSITRELLSKYPLRYVVATPLLCFMPVAMLMKFAFNKVKDAGSRMSNKMRRMLTTLIESFDLA